MFAYLFFFFFFNNTATTEIYTSSHTLSLHDALPISLERELAGEHLERHDAEGVDVGAPVQRSPADLLRAHELRRAEDDAGRRQLRDRRIGAALLGEAEVHDHGAVTTPVLPDEHDVLGLQ